MSALVNRWVTRLAIGLATLLAVSITLLAGTGFFCFALYQWLHESLSAPAAAAATGIAAFAAAAICVLAASLIAALRNKRPAKRHGSESVLAVELANLLGKDVAALAAANPLETILVSLASGFALGASPGLRRALGDLLGRR